MHFLGYISIRKSAEIFAHSGVKQPAGEVEHMFEGNHSLCWCEFRLLGRSLLNNNWIPEFRQVVAKRGIERDLSLLDELQRSQLAIFILVNS